MVGFFASNKNHLNTEGFVTKWTPEVGLGVFGSINANPLSIGTFRVLGGKLGHDFSFWRKAFHLDLPDSTPPQKVDKNKLFKDLVKKAMEQK